MVVCKQLFGENICKSSANSSPCPFVNFQLFMFPYSVAAPFDWRVFGVGTGKIVLHSITCNGSPTGLVNCNYSLVQGSSSAGCSLHYDAGIRCYGVLL